MSQRRAEHAPPSIEATLDELRGRFENVLAEYALSPLPRFSIVVEGMTDVAYLEATVAKYQGAVGQDLLAVPEEQGGGRIGLITPCRPGTHRGGVPMVVRLARDISVSVFTLRLVRRVLFLFDHDQAGIEAATKISEFGFVRDDHCLTLDPTEHPGALAKKAVTIEQLLSLDVQDRFFEIGGAWCSKIYEEGIHTRYDWAHESKGALCDFVCESGSLVEFRELIRLLHRVRRTWGFPVGPLG